MGTILRVQRPALDHDAARFVELAPGAIWLTPPFGRLVGALQNVSAEILLLTCDGRPGPALDPRQLDLDPAMQAFRDRVLASGRDLLRARERAAERITRIGDTA